MPGQIIGVTRVSNEIGGGGEEEGLASLEPLQCSRLKSSMPFKRDLALQNIPLSNQPFKTQPEIENEDVT
jgi:hypothetical protein